MKKNIINSTKTLVLAVILATGVSYLFAWTGPTATPPGNNTAAPLSVATSSQTKMGPLILNYANLVTPGLEVLGGIQIVDGTQGVGKVLRSDANGVSSWVATSSLGISGGSSGVSQITAGTRVTVTPSGGTGNVTVNSSATGTIGGGCYETSSDQTIDTNPPARGWGNGTPTGATTQYAGCSCSAGYTSQMVYGQANNGISASGNYAFLCVAN